MIQSLKKLEIRDDGPQKGGLIPVIRIMNHGASTSALVELKWILRQGIYRRRLSIRNGWCRRSRSSRRRRGSSSALAL